jgi:hypothetical protein
VKIGIWIKNENLEQADVTFFDMPVAYVRIVPLSDPDKSELTLRSYRDGILIRSRTYPVPSSETKRFVPDFISGVFIRELGN